MSTNVQMLEIAVDHLEPLLEEVVFVGHLSLPSSRNGPNPRRSAHQGVDPRFREPLAGGGIYPCRGNQVGFRKADPSHSPALPACDEAGGFRIAREAGLL